MKIKKSLLNKIIVSILLLHSSVSFGDNDRAEVIGDFNQEGEILYASPLFKSFTKLDAQGSPLKGSEFTKIYGTGRDKLQLIPGDYEISAMCSGSLSSTMGKAKITLESGKSYKVVCSTKDGKQKLIIKSISQFLFNKWAPKN